MHIYIYIYVCVCVCVCVFVILFADFIVHQKHSQVQGVPVGAPGMSCPMGMGPWAWGRGDKCNFVYLVLPRPLESSRTVVVLAVAAASGNQLLSTLT